MRLLHNSDLEPVALIPDGWRWYESWHPDKGPLMSFDLCAHSGPSWLATRVEDMSPVTREMKTVTIRYVRVHHVFHMIVVAGLRHLVEHPEVATYPRARQ